MDSPKAQKSAPDSATFMDLIREVGDKATEQVRQEMLAQATASSPAQNSETKSHALQREMAAQSVLQRGLASSMEEALQMVDDAI